MTIYITKLKKNKYRKFRSMMTGDSRQETLDFGYKIGINLRNLALYKSGHINYIDVSPDKVTQALRQGAVFVSKEELLIKIRRAIQQSKTN